MTSLLLRVSLLLALALVAFMLAVLTARRGDAAVLAFVSQRDGAAAMYLHDLVTGRTLPLRGTSGLTYDLAWSPHSRWFGYARWTAGNVEVFVHDLKQGETRNISNHTADDTGLYWSPSGQQMAFVSQRDGQVDIYRADVHSGTVVNLTDHPADDFSPAWSPDGERLVFVSNRDETDGLRRDGLFGLYLLDVASGDVRYLLSAASLESLAWSPDGSWLTLVAYSDRDRRWDVVVVDARSGESLRVAENAFLPVWSPDGAWLAFSGPVGRIQGVGRVYVARAGEWEPEVIYASDSERYEYLTWSPDGRWLAVGGFASRDNRIRRGIHLLDVHAGDEITLSGELDYDVYPVWSPDGSWLAFTSWRDFNNEVYVWDMQRQAFTNISQYPGEDVLPAWVFGAGWP